jgi:hypothetical protein
MRRGSTALSCSVDMVKLRWVDLWKGHGGPRQVPGPLRRASPIRAQGYGKWEMGKAWRYSFSFAR